MPTIELKRPFWAKDGTLYRPGKSVKVPASVAKELGITDPDEDTGDQPATNAQLAPAPDAEVVAKAVADGIAVGTAEVMAGVREILSALSGSGAITAATTPAATSAATELPNDFPGRAELVKAGLPTVESVAAKSDADLTGLPGIGEATVKRIAERDDVKRARAA